MVVLQPSRVSFSGMELGGVSSVLMDRVASQLVADPDGSGPWIVFADAVERRASVEVRRAVESTELESVHLGAQGDLIIEIGPSAADGGRFRISVMGVASKVTHRIVSGAGRDVAEQVIRIECVSIDGVTDPLRIEAI